MGNSGVELVTSLNQASTEIVFPNALVDFVQCGIARFDLDLRQLACKIRK